MNWLQRLIMISFGIGLFMFGFAMCEENNFLTAVIALTVAAGFLFYGSSGKLKSVEFRKFFKGRKFKIIVGLVTMIVLFIIGLCVYDNQYGKKYSTPTITDSFIPDLKEEIKLYKKEIKIIDYKIASEKSSSNYFTFYYLYVTIKNTGTTVLFKASCQLSYYDSNNYLVKTAEVTIPMEKFFKLGEVRKYKIFLPNDASLSSAKYVRTTLEPLY